MRRQYAEGIGQGAIVFLLGWFFRSPDQEALEAKHPAPEQSGRPHYGPLDLVRAPLFWIMYVMFVMMAAGGLMAVAQLGPIAADFKIADTPVTLAGITPRSRWATVFATIPDKRRGAFPG